MVMSFGFRTRFVSFGKFSYFLKGRKGPCIVNVIVSR